MQLSAKTSTIGKLYQELHQTHIKLAGIWVQQTYLHPGWWMSLALTIVPWFVWVWLRKRDSSFRLMLVGFFTIIVACWMDFLGVSAGLWYYANKLIPTMPAFMPFDCCLLPVLVMFFIQYHPAVSPIIKALAFSGLCAFVAEPIFEWGGFYVPVRWNAIYSFLIYFLIYLIAHWLSRRTSFEAIGGTEDGRSQTGG